MNEEEREKLREEYLNSPLIPVNISSYNKVIIQMYKQRMFAPKYLLLYILIWFPTVFWLSWIRKFMPINDALQIGAGSLLLFLLVFPPALIYLRLIFAKINPKNGLRKYGHLKAGHLRIKSTFMRS